MAKPSTRSAYNLLKENRTKGHNSQTKKKNKSRPRNKVDDLDKFAIRQVVHQFFSNNELPALEKVLAEVKLDENLTQISRSCLLKILKKDLGFKFAKHQQKSILLPRNETIVSRRKYLREIKNLREEEKKIYFSGETWLNEGHTDDKAITNQREEFNEGLRSTGKRLVISHIGSSTGFVDEGLLFFVSESSGVYHEDMSADVYEKWFKKVLTHLEPNSVIVLDNASYHSRKQNKAPSFFTRKDDIKQWLKTNSINFDDDMFRIELLDIVKHYKAQYETYVVDEIARAAGHKVLRLPTYHCELNAIHLVWTQVKEFVASHNKSLNIAGIKDLLRTALAKIDAEIWHRCVQQVELVVEPKMWETDLFIEKEVESLSIKEQSSSSNSSSE